MLTTLSVLTRDQGPSWQPGDTGSPDDGRCDGIAAKVRVREDFGLPRWFRLRPDRLGEAPGPVAPAASRPRGGKMGVAAIPVVR